MDTTGKQRRATVNNEKAAGSIGNQWKAEMPHEQHENNATDNRRTTEKHTNSTKTYITILFTRIN